MDGGYCRIAVALVSYPSVAHADPEKARQLAAAATRRVSFRYQQQRSAGSYPVAHSVALDVSERRCIVHILALRSTRVNDYQNFIIGEHFGRKFVLVYGDGETVVLQQRCQWCVPRFAQSV